MNRLMTIISRSAVSGTANLVTRITATSYAGDEVQMDMINADAEGYDVHTMINVTIEPWEGPDA